jgi:predicted phosphodiesterase
VNRPTRIISDLHFGHPASFVRDLRQIAPLVEGADQMIFNGDSVEMRFRREQEKAAGNAALLREMCLSMGAEPVLVNGNHDPRLSPVNHVDLAGGKVLVTHGDVLFRGLSPWSRESAKLRATHASELEARGNPADLESQLAAARVTAVSVEHLNPTLFRGPEPRSFLSLVREFWPPVRPYRIVECWVQTPSKASTFAGQYRPEARFVVIGHTHWGGFWHVGGRLVVNTGGFLPLSRRYAVDVCQEAFTIRKIVMKQGSFRLGRVVARVPCE